MTVRSAPSPLSHILLATDFSPRSDRAARRAALLAKQSGARLTIVHTVDDDRPDRLVNRARREAFELLEEMRSTLTEVDGIECDVKVSLGEAFAGILAVSDEVGADILVIGPHRRRILRDVFTGTTAERTIRESRIPVLMANAMPAGPYRNVLVATDLSDASLAAFRACGALGFSEAATVTLVHLFDTPARGLLRRASLADDALADHASEEKARAEQELRAFVARARCRPDRVEILPAEGPVAAGIEKAAGDCRADLVVVGTRGRSGVARMILGSVAEMLLRGSDRDVLAVPPGDGSGDAA